MFGLKFRAIWVLILVLLNVAFTFAARCTKPSIRREWRSLSTIERAEWIRAVKCLTSLPHTDALTPLVNPPDIPPVNSSSTFYDDFVYMHMDLNTHIHFTGLFLPWHRWYIQVYETALREKCGFKGASPYWDWSKDAADVEHASIFRDPDSESGLGGFGDPSLDYTVTNGAFFDFMVAYPSPHILRRNFTLQPYLPFAGVPIFPEPEKTANTSFTKSEVHKMVNGFVGDFQGFQKYFEAPEGAHGAVHFIVGGDLAGTCPANSVNCIPGPTFSANEPMFWLHHAMVDKVWFEWQRAHPSNFWSFKGGSIQNLTSVEAYETYPNGMPPMLSFDSVMPAEGMFSASTIRDVFNTTGGFLCYEYE
ncbi:Di-copper centre-containing protein [Panus rudis PR-1116 ss-1]|nr:Di-copper centre-containing protein [Panus rudis PR-1116 ss-1]